MNKIICLGCKRQDINLLTHSRQCIDELKAFNSELSDKIEAEYTEKWKTNFMIEDLDE